MISSAGRRALYTWERRGKKIGWSVIRAVFILGFAFVILYSPIGMLARAFMSPQDLYDSSVLWLPKHFTFTNIEIAARMCRTFAAYKRRQDKQTVVFAV